ncbi:MAG: branched-chain amino acid ABC transporter permease [Fimbriimonadaceae bacterium]
MTLSPMPRKLGTQAQEAQNKVSALEGEIAQKSVGVTITVGKLIMLVTVIVLMLILRFLVMATPAGRAMRAVSHDFESASLMGINVNKVITFTFMLGSALAGAGAMMLVTFEGTAIHPFFGLQLGVKAFVAAVLGGIGNIPGAVLGGFLMGFAETLVVWAGYSNYKDAVAFVILIVVLLLKPGGILGSSKVEKV